MNSAIPNSALSEGRLLYQNIGLLLGPGIFALMMILGHGQEFMPEMAWRVAAVGLWMGIWWATEAIPVPATAFIPLVMFDLLGIAPIATASQSYAHPIIYLFLGALYWPWRWSVGIYTSASPWRFYRARVPTARS